MFEDVTPSEILLLSIINELGEGDVFRLLERTSLEKDWKYSTVKSFAERLHKKGYVEAKKVGRRWVYYPAMPKEKSFMMIMKQIFGLSLDRDLSLMVSYLVNEKKLSKRDEEILKTLLENPK
ncbi:MAG: BlaI/MecI/CopY family transcriptional regulator [Candidatus Omnitrophota bacterium]